MRSKIRFAPRARGARSTRALRAGATAAMVAALLAAGCGASAEPGKVLADARSALDKRDTRTAEIQLKDLLQRDQGNGEARLLLAQVHATNGDVAGAEKEFRRALDAGIARDRVVPGLLDVLLRAGQAQKAIDEAAALPVESPAARADVALAVGRAQMALRRTDEARKSFEQALAAQPGLAAAKAGLIALVAQQGDREAATRQAAELLKQAPDSPEALEVAADLELSAGRLDAARELLGRLLQRSPNDVPARAKMAATLIDLKQYDAAKTQLDEMAKRAPNAPATFQLLGTLELRRGNLAAAREASQNALRAGPDYLPAIALAANVALADNSPALAESHARKLVERAPEWVQGHRLLAAAYLRMNEPERALQTVQPLLARGSQDPQLLAIAGEAALKRNDFTQASQYFEKATKLDPTDAGKRTGLALSRMSAGEHDRGLADLEAAAQLDSGSFQADYALIATHLRERRYDQALAAIDALEKKQPKNPLVQNMRGAAQVMKGDLAAGRKAFEAALALQPTYFPAASNLAALDERQDKADDARKRFEAVLAADPKNTQALLALAQHAIRHGGSKEQVRQYLDRARSANPDALAPVAALAAWHLDNGAPRDAVALLQDALAKQPDRPELLELLASAQARAGDRDQALQTYDRLVRSAPASAPLQMRVGEARLNLRDDAGALAAFRRAVELAPKAIEPRVALAAMMARRGNKAEARQLAASLRKDFPSNPAGLLLEGDFASADQKWGEAIDAYRKADAVARTPQGTMRLHQALLRAGRDGEAEAALRGYLKDAPDDLSMRLYGAEQSLGRKRWSDAAEQYRAVLERQPRNLVALNNLAWALHQLKDPKAREVAEQAFSLAPKSAPIVDTLGVINAEGGDAARGVELLRQAVTLAPGEPQYRLHLAEALLRQGDKAGAREQVDSILRDVPAGPLAQSARDLGKRL